MICVLSELWSVQQWRLERAWCLFGYHILSLGWAWTCVEYCILHYGTRKACM
jgi:hypothetical protein